MSVGVPYGGRTLPQFLPPNDLWSSPTNCAPMYMAMQNPWYGYMPPMTTDGNMSLQHLVTPLSYGSYKLGEFLKKPTSFFPTPMFGDLAENYSALGPTSARKRSRNEMSAVNCEMFVNKRITTGNMDEEGKTRDRSASEHSKDSKRGADMKLDKKSIYRGVFWNNQSKVWIASITALGKKKHLGCFDKEVEAALAYDKEAIKLKGSLATTNFTESEAKRLTSTSSSDDSLETTRHVRRKAERTSKFRGVCWNKYNSSWKACIKVNGKNMHLGYFDSEEDAAKAYDKTSTLYRGGKAKLNFPTDN